MTGADVVAIILAVVVAMVAGAVVVALMALNRTLRDLRGAVEQLRSEVLPLVDELNDTVTTAAYEVERVDRLVGAAETVTQRVDGAQRAAYRTVAAPVVKAMALKAGVSRGAKRLVGAEPAPGSRRGRRGRRRGHRTGNVEAVANRRTRKAS